MQFMKNSFIFLIFSMITVLSVILLSCNNNKIYSERVTIENFRWYSVKPVVFEAQISEKYIKKPLKLFLSIRYIQGFPYKNLDIRISITDPNGVMNYKDLSIPVISDDFKYIGDGAGDYWDLDYAVDNNIVLDVVGKYTIKIASMMKEDPVNFINDIAITFENQQKEE
jgi:gliding motility-associated lipoprotein GldH